MAALSDAQIMAEAKFAVPVMVRYLDSQGGHLDPKTRDKQLFWFVQTGMWGRFSGSVESFIDKDLGILEQSGGDLDKLRGKLRLAQGGLRVESGHFHSWSVGAQFEPPPKHSGLGESAELISIACAAGSGASR